MAARHTPAAAALALWAVPLLLLLLLAAPASAHGGKHRRRKKGSSGPSCSTLDKNCGFVTGDDLEWQKSAATFVLTTADDGAVTCAPANADGLSHCEYLNELSELRMDVTCPGGEDYAVFQTAVGTLVDVQPDGTATFDPWIPGITQSAIDATAYATVGGVYGPNAGDEAFWSVEVLCQPQFYPDGYPSGALAGGKVAGGVRRRAVAGVASVSPAAAARIASGSKKAAAGGGSG